ncbi:MAG: radical SAM family heme chaperone HemW [Polyangiales bacterium]
MQPLHVYVHFPWCLEKCPYCDFVSFKTTREAIAHDEYARAVIRELHARASWLRDTHRVATVFFGGGTPSLWEPTALGEVVRAIRATFACEPDVEISAECNPTSLDEKRAAGLLEAGVNRLSIGVQSLDADQLKFLGRLHDPESARRAVRNAIAIAPRVSADLIFGLPKQSAEQAAAHAAELVDLGLHHLSAYSLTIEPGTRFGELARRGRLPIAEEDSTCDAFLAIERALGERGLAHYEVSNYARPGHEARHNLGYWNGAPYLGLGVAAYGCGPTGRNGSIRYRNEIDPGRYVAANVRSGMPALDDGMTVSVEPLDAETLLRERIMLGLRLSDGLDLAEAARAVGLDAELALSSRAKVVDRLVTEGGLARSGSRLRIPGQRRLSTDGIAARLF